MRSGFDPFSLLVVSVAGWMNRHQQHVIEYLMEENRVLREQLGHRRMVLDRVVGFPLSGLLNRKVVDYLRRRRVAAAADED